MQQQELIDRYAKAIARQEGYYNKKAMPTVAQRCNNPGNLTHWKDPNGEPYPELNGYVHFPDEETGFRALRSQCKINILKRGLTFYEFFAGKRGVYGGFCPRDDNKDPMLKKNDPLVYAQHVLGWVAGPDTRLTIHHRIDALLDAPAQKAA